MAGPSTEDIRAGKLMIAGLSPDSAIEPLGEAGFSPESARTISTNINVLDLIMSVNDAGGSEATKKNLVAGLNKMSPEGLATLNKSLGDDKSLIDKIAKLSESNPDALKAKMPEIMKNPQNLKSIMGDIGATPVAAAKSSKPATPAAVVASKGSSGAEPATKISSLKAEADDIKDRIVADKGFQDLIKFTAEKYPGIHKAITGKMTGGDAEPTKEEMTALRGIDKQLKDDPEYFEKMTKMLHDQPGFASQIEKEAEKDPGKALALAGAFNKVNGFAEKFGSMLENLMGAEQAQGIMGTLIGFLAKIIPGLVGMFGGNFLNMMGDAENSKDMKATGTSQKMGNNFTKTVIALAESGKSFTADSKAGVIKVHGATDTDTPKADESQQENEVSSAVVQGQSLSN